MTHEQWYNSTSIETFPHYRSDYEISKVGWDSALKYGVSIPLFTDIMKEMFDEDWCLRKDLSDTEKQLHTMYNLIRKKIENE